MRGLKWFEVGEMRGHISDDDVDLFQVKLTAWFELED
jgi:flavin-binding protein dodecin